MTADPVRVLEEILRRNGHADVDLRDNAAVRDLLEAGE